MNCNQTITKSDARSFEIFQLCTLDSSINNCSNIFKFRNDGYIRTAALINVSSFWMQPILRFLMQLLQVQQVNHLNSPVLLLISILCRNATLFFIVSDNSNLGSWSSSSNKSKFLWSMNLYRSFPELISPPLTTAVYKQLLL